MLYGRGRPLEALTAPFKRGSVWPDILGRRAYTDKVQTKYGQGTDNGFSYAEPLPEQAEHRIHGNIWDSGRKRPASGLIRGEE